MIQQVDKPASNYSQKPPSLRTGHSQSVLSSGRAIRTGAF